MKIVLTIILSFCIFLGFTQEVKVLKTEATLLDLSTQGEKEFQQLVERYDAIIDKLDSGFKEEDLPEADQQFISGIDEIYLIQDYWDAVGDACSWYCGGGPDSVYASSSLEGNYAPKNAHDLNFKNAWVEGVEGHGIGEYLEYRFEARSPRITNIIIVPGYVKSQEAWNANSRVKEMDLLVNGKLFATFQFEDVRGEHEFEFEPIGRFSETEPWTMRFVIKAVYPGEKYEDTVISEIYFDGIDVH